MKSFCKENRKQGRSIPLRDLSDSPSAISTAPPMQDRGMEWKYLLLLELFQQMKPPMTIQGDMNKSGLVFLDLGLETKQPDTVDITSL